MKQNLRRILMCAVLAGLPFMHVRAHDWVPVGDGVQNVSYTYTNPEHPSITNTWTYNFVTSAAAYLAQDVVAWNSPAVGYNKSFTAAPGDTELNIYGTVYTDYPENGGTEVGAGIPCSLKINGNVELTALTNDMDIYIHKSAQQPTNPVVIEPYYYAPAMDVPYAEAGASQVYFNTGSGRTITVYVDNDLEFRGKTVVATSGEETETITGQDLLVTFAGPGLVKFVMADGTFVKFNGQIDYSAPYVTVGDTEYPFIDQPAHNAGGTRVFICMDQENETDTKVLFQRTASADQSTRVLIEVGPNSFITYLSTDPTGDGTTEPAQSLGYGAIDFDTGNAGAGRMVLFLRGAYWYDFITSKLVKFPFNDASVMINGHYLGTAGRDVDFAPEKISGYTNGGALTTPLYDLSMPAGTKAHMRVISTDGALVDPTVYSTDEATRRGLLVVSDVASHGKLMSDPYWDLYNNILGAWGYGWSPSNVANQLNNVRKGFILGVNGQMDVADWTFVDYVAGSGNTVDPLAWHDFESGRVAPTKCVLKDRNPSALIIDGLDTALFVDGNPSNADAISPFIIADPYTQIPPTLNPSVATINARGNGTVYLRSSVQSNYGYLYSLFPDNTEDLLNEPTLNWTTILAVGTGTYDGYKLSANDYTVQSGEGMHVLDVEGPLKAQTPVLLAGRAGAEDDTTGVINAASILLNYRGEEIFVNGDPVTRPLLNDATEYTRYNSPTLFFNNFASFHNFIVRHSDATKKVDGIPFINSEPGITGGERLYFAREHIGTAMANTQSDPDRYRLPEIRFYNSTLELQESLNASGVRFVVKDNFGDASRTGDNESVFRFFDHGDPLDTMLTGHGRIFLCGSIMSRMFDNSFNYATNSCSIDVFKHNAADGGFKDLSATVKLSLQNGDQFDPSIQAIIDALADDQAKMEYMSKQRAHHMILFALPIKSNLNTMLLENILGYTPWDVASVCNMTIGWPADTQYTQVASDPIEGLLAPRGNSAVFPYCYPYVFPAEPIYDGTATAQFTSELFDIDALNQLPPATLSIDGSIMCFGAFDLLGKTVATPAVTDDDSGVVYVKHGGKITITRPEALPGTELDRTSIPYQSVFSTFVAHRIWNDYDAAGTDRVCQLTGIVDLPHDQVTFDNKLYGYGVQSYNITDNMFAARRADTDGYVRLSYENTERNVQDSFYNDASGAEEVIIGWHNRSQMTPRVENTPPKSSRAAISNTFKWLMRATESVGTPAPRPQDLLYVGPGDDVTQLHVAGATMSDPFLLDVSGDGVRPISARVREFVSVSSTTDINSFNYQPVADHFISEGAHAVLFVEYNGRVGLGTRHWNELSNSAWNLLGKDYVTICPLGDGTVDVNNNLLVVDRQALIATEKFGNPEEEGFDAHRLTFYAEMPYEIRVPAYGELDLSSFGQGAVRQEIAFGGKVKLIFEEGATLRLPDNPSAAGLVLYFNDQSQLIFEGSTQGSTFIPYTDAKNNTYVGNNTAPAARDRIKIIGQGQIWLNKDAKMQVNGNTFVGVETDSLTKTTALTVSIQRQGSWYIGDENVAGGAFQVGNPTDLGLDHSITFSLVLNGPRALMHIDREGFLGLAAGVINKYGNPNGSVAALADNPVTVDGVVQTESVTVGGRTYTVPAFTPDIDPWNGEWQVQALNNVGNVVINLVQGTFSHNNIYNGASSQASLMAIGPATTYELGLNGSDYTEVRGGGNIMWVPVTATADLPIFVNIWDYAGVGDKGGEGENITAGAVKFADDAVCFYSLLASAPMLLDRQGNNGDLGEFNYRNAGRWYNGDHMYFYNALAFRALGLPIGVPTVAFSPLQNNKMSCFSETQFADIVGYATNQPKYSTAGNDGTTYYGLQTARSTTISLEQISVSQSFAPAAASGTLGATVGLNGLVQAYAIIK